MPNEIPQHLLRYRTSAATAALAKRFDLPHDPSMQDWEWEVADSARIDEFLDAYIHGGLPDDERFVLMKMLLQSFEDLGADAPTDPRWPVVLELLEADMNLHISTVWYWSQLGTDTSEAWAVSPSLRHLLAKHRERFVGNQG